MLKGLLVAAIVVLDLAAAFVLIVAAAHFGRVVGGEDGSTLASLFALLYVAKNFAAGFLSQVREG